MIKIKKMLSTLRVMMGYTLLAINTIFIASIFYPVGLIKKFNNNKTVAKYCLKYLHAAGQMWVSINYCIVKLISGIKWQVSGLEQIKDLPKNTWYLLISNHQSWNDVLILQFLFKRQLPFQKYLVKEKMRKFPIMGFVWEALDCPFLKRQNLSADKTKDPNNVTNNINDVDIIKDNCKKFKLAPASIISFVEGTRFTKKKHNEQRSPFKNLLKPKVGGVAAILEELHHEIHAIVDVTLCYLPRKMSFWDLFSGGIKKIHADVRLIEIPEWLQENYKNNIHYSQYKDELQKWLDAIWKNKDQFMTLNCYN